MMSESRPNVLRRRSFPAASARVPWNSVFSAGLLQPALRRRLAAGVDDGAEAMHLGLCTPLCGEAGDQALQRGAQFEQLAGCCRVDRGDSRAPRLDLDEPFRRERA